MKATDFLFCGIFLIALNPWLSMAQTPSANLPDPDGQPADMQQPVQVFILLGQSNMLGFGKVKGDKDGTLEYATSKKKLYPYLVDADGQWTQRMDVRNVRVMGSGLGGSRLLSLIHI